MIFTSSSSLFSRSTTRRSLFAGNARFLLALVVADDELRAFEPQVGQSLAHGALVEDIFALFFADDLVKRRLGDVDPAGADQLRHVPEEERQQQRADVAAVDVGVGHDDDLAVAALFEVEILAEAAAEGADDRADLLVTRDLHGVGFFDVQDFSKQRQDRLDIGIAPLLGAAAGGVALDQENLRLLVGFAAAIRQFAGKAVAFQAIFAAGQLARLSGRLARLGGEHALLEDRLGFLGILLENRRPAFRSPPAGRTTQLPGSAACLSSGFQTAARGA